MSSARSNCRHSGFPAEVSRTPLTLPCAPARKLPDGPGLKSRTASSRNKSTSPSPTGASIQITLKGRNPWPYIRHHSRWVANSLQNVGDFGATIKPVEDNLKVLHIKYGYVLQEVLGIGRSHWLLAKRASIFNSSSGLLIVGWSLPDYLHKSIYVEAAWCLTAPESSRTDLETYQNPIMQKKKN